MDPNLIYPKEIHDKFNTSSGPTPILKQEQFHGSTNYMEIIGSYAKFLVPKQVLFTNAHESIR